MCRKPHRLAVWASVAAVTALTAGAPDSVCDRLPRLALCPEDPDGLDWHRSVHLPTPPAAAAHAASQECTVLAQTDGRTCASFCQAHGFQCVRGQDNALDHPSSCALDRVAGGGGGNGCFETLEDQVCACQVSQHAAPPPPPPPPCRADICVDDGNDCCAPGDEQRGCSEEGYVVVPGGSSSWAPCLSTYGASAVYQCCPTGSDGTPMQEISHLPCAQPRGVPVASTAHARSAAVLRLSPGVRLRRWRVVPDLHAIDALPDLAQVLADYDMTTEVMTEYFESPRSVCDHCITELDAVFEAAVNGEYAFVVAADDDFRLWFGDTEEDAMFAGPIVSVTGYTSPREWNKYGDQQLSTPVQLNAGNSYFIRARVHEHSGDDHLAVAITAAGTTISDGTLSARSLLPMQVSNAAFGALYVPSLLTWVNSATDFFQGQLQPLPFLPVERFSQDFVAPTKWEYMAFVSDRPGNLTFSQGENTGTVPQVALVGNGSIFTARVNAHLVANSESPLGNAEGPLGHSFSLDQFILTGGAQLVESASDPTVLQLTSTDLGQNGQAFYRLASPDLSAGFELQFDMYTGDLACDFETGDGIGGYEAYIGVAPSPQACVQMVQQQHPEANGVTYSNTDGTACYAEFGMTGSNDSPSWQTCLMTGLYGGPYGQCVSVGNNYLGGRPEEDGVSQGIAVCFDEYPKHAAPPPPPPPPCRADICVDDGNDCCAPGDEQRGCSEEGYVVVPGGSSSWAPCLSTYGASAVYQCCPTGSDGTPMLDGRTGDSGISILFDGVVVWEHRVLVSPPCNNGDCGVVSDENPVEMFADATWHHVRLSVETSGRIALDFDHGIYQAVADIDDFMLRFIHERAYDLHLGFTGFTGRSGSVSNRHLLRKVSMDFGVDVDAVVTPGPAGLLIHSTVPASGILRAWETRDELLLVGDAGHSDSTLIVVVEAPPLHADSWNHASEEVAGRLGEWTIALAPGTGTSCIEPDTDVTLVLSGLSNDTFVVRTRPCDDEDCGVEHVALVTLYSRSNVDGSAAVQQIRATCSREWTLVSATFREVERSSCAEVGMFWCRESNSCIPSALSQCAHGSIVSVTNGNTIARNGVPLCTLDAGEAWSGRVLSGDVFTGTAAMHGSVLRDRLVFNHSSPGATAGNEVQVPPVTFSMLNGRLSGTSFVLSDLGASARVYVSCLSKQGACRVGLALPAEVTAAGLSTRGEWTSSAGGMPQTTSCPDLGDIVGGPGILGGEGDWVQVTFDLSDKPHTLASVSLNFVKLDSWDDERAQISVDGIEVWSETFSVNQGESNKCGRHWNDLLRAVSATVPHSTATLTLRITTTLDQPPNDEAWGVSDVTVLTDAIDIVAVVPPGIGAVTVPLRDHSGTMRLLSDALVMVAISVTDSDLMPVPPASSDWVYGIPSPMLVGSANTAKSQLESCVQIEGPSGSACCGQVPIHIECPEGTTIIAGHITGTCCSKACPVGGTSCFCDWCDTGSDENWSSGLMCGPPQGACRTIAGDVFGVQNFVYVQEESSNGGREEFQPSDPLLWSRSGYATEGRGHASRVRLIHSCAASMPTIVPYEAPEGCGAIKVASFVWWALHWCSWCWGCRQPRWQDNCHHCDAEHWRANRHAIPQWRQVNIICASVVLQIVFGALLRTSRCGKDGWGITHIVLGSLTAVFLPCLFCTKLRVGARQEQQQAEHAAFVAQAAMAANAAQREGGAARASGSLARNDSILLQRKLQPVADPEVMAARMEKPLSPLAVQLINKFSRIECATCNGAGILKPGSMSIAQPRGDPSIKYVPSAVPPTIESIDKRSPLSSQLSPGDVVLRVAYRIREDDGDESSGDTLVRSRTAGDPFDCAAMDGRQLNAALRARTSSASLCGEEAEAEAEADEQVLVILPASVHGVKSRQMPTIPCLVCAGHGTVDQYVGSFAAPQEPDEHPCEVCYDDSKYGVSTECLHFYCEDCIRGSLEAILDQGQFPAYCPACRVESDGVHDEPVKGRIEGPALTFLESKGVIALDFQYRFMRQQEGSTAEKFFKCPNSGCKHYLIDQDPQYAVVPRGSTEVEGFVRKMRLGKCECGARVCVRCHAMAEPDVRRAIEKLADVTKDNLEDLEREGGVSHWKTLQMDDVAGMLDIKHGDLVQVDRGPRSRSSGEVVARTYSGNMLPPSTEPIVPMQDLPVGEYVVRKVANVRESRELSSSKVHGIHGNPINLKAGSTVTVLEVSGKRVRHALGWSSVIGHRSGDTIMEPVAPTGRLKGTIAEVTGTHFVVDWDEATRGVLALQPQLLREHAAGEGEWTESAGRVELPDLWVVIKDSYSHECPTELNRELSTDPATRKLMESIGKHCPNCGAFIQKNDGCNIMMCGTTAHGRLADALAHGGCGHLFHWDSLKPAKTFYIGLDGQRVDNYIGGVATDGGGAMP